MGAQPHQAREPRDEHPSPLGGGGWGGEGEGGGRGEGRGEGEEREGGGRGEGRGRRLRGPCGKSLQTQSFLFFFSGAGCSFVVSFLGLEASKRAKRVLPGSTVLCFWGESFWENQKRSRPKKYQVQISFS